MSERNVVVTMHHAPYGTIFYTEGLRAAVGATAGIDEHQVTVVFLGDGALYALKDVERTDSLHYLETLKAVGASLYVEAESLEARSIEPGALYEDVEVIPRSRVSEIILAADHTFDC
jgi:sulfur relay (sulfurtransferase) DsrF/TusC family protein